MATRYDNTHISMFISVDTDLDFGVDLDNNLYVIRRNNWGVSDEKLCLGPLTHTLIHHMQQCLDHLKTHAIKH